MLSIPTHDKIQKMKNSILKRQPSPSPQDRFDQIVISAPEERKLLIARQPSELEGRHLMTIRSTLLSQPLETLKNVVIATAITEAIN